MKALFFLFSILFFISCDETRKEINDEIIVEKITIPAIEKNRKHLLFQLKNGVLFFDIKPFSGVVKEFYAEGSIKSTAQYYLGKRQGTYFGWYQNKKKWFERFYINGLKAKVHKGWHKNGMQMFVYHFKNTGVYNGSVKDWYANGVLAKSFNFIEGKEAGAQKMWDFKGRIKANFFTVANERHGLIGLKKCVSVLHDKN